MCACTCMRMCVRVRGDPPVEWNCEVGSVHGRTGIKVKSGT